MLLKGIMPLYLSSLILGVFSRDVNTINMVISFLSHEHDDRATKLWTPGLCWKSYHQKHLAKCLSEQSIFVSSGQSLQVNWTEHYLQHIVLLVDLSCSNAVTILLFANKLEYFKSPYRWLLISSEDDKRTQDILKEIDILLDSDVVVAERLSADQFVFSSVYKVAANTEVIKHLRGGWYANIHTHVNTELSNDTNKIDLITKLNSDDERLQIRLATKEMKISKHGILKDYRQSKVLCSKRHNLRGHVLTMSNVVTDSNETRKHLDDRLMLHQDSIAKMSYMVVKICFEMLNATEKLVFTHTWGYRDQHGNWQGQIKLLMNREADLGTLTIFTQDRMRQVDYIAMVGTTAVRFVFREPPLAYVSNIFALPFTGAVWLAILICVLGCSVFLYITSKWEASMGMHPLQLDGSWADVLILIIGAVLQQGCTLEPRYAAGRAVTLLLFIALTILYAAYSANIVVLLRAPSSSVRSLADLLNSPLKLGASDFEYNRYFFKQQNETIRKAIYEKKIAPKGKKPSFFSMKEGVEKIRQGLFAFHMELNPGYRLIQDTYQEDEKCDLVEIDYLNEIDPWVPGQKRGVYRDLFKINFIKIRESGIQSCIQRRLHVFKPRCSGTVATFSSVGLTDIYPALLMTFYGFLVAPVTLLLEISYKRLLLIREKRMTH